jgi:hypothetical protein
MDLRGRCGYEWNVSVPSPLGAAVGTCINGFANGEPTGVVDCTQRHDAETLSLHDLTADYPTWPGRRTLIEDIEQRCSADADAVESDFSDLAFAWILPTRTMWEQEARTAICLIGQGSGQSWEEPSGLLPAPPSTAAVTASQEPTTGEGFESLQDDTGQLSMRVPSGWSQRDTAPVDVGADSPVPGIAAAPDLDRFMASYSDPGVLALLYPPGDAAPSPDDVLSEVSPTDCRAQPRNDWSTAAFTGRQQRFDCGGSQLLLVAAVPAGRPDARLVFYGQWDATGDDAAILESLASLVITG